MGALFQELKRRNLFKVGAAYIVLSWFILQVGSLLAPIMNLPDVILSVVVFFLILGFPLALLFAWAFEMTPDGIKRTGEVERSISATGETGKKLNMLTSALLAAVIVLLLANRYLLPGQTSIASNKSETTTSKTLGTRVYESIAVLPFVNMSDDTAQEYFSDGISEELLNLLAKTKGLRVAARTSSFAYKGQNQNIKKIGKDLDVQTVLEGSVRKADTTLRITAQLIDVDTGFHLWSETYDRELEDVFAIQDEISAAIVTALQVHFGGEASEAPKQSYQPSLAAYEHYLMGQESIKKRTKKDIEEALEHFAMAIKADAKFAPAYALKADAYMLLSNRPGAYGDIPMRYAVEFARPLVDLALELDPGLPEAHNSNGFLLHSQQKREEALVSYNKAIDLSPSFAIAHMWRAQLLDDLYGELTSVPALEQAYKLDPMSPLIMQNLAMRLVQLRQFERANYLASKLEEVAPDKAAGVTFIRAEMDASQGRFAEAFRKLDATSEGSGVMRLARARAASTLNNEEEFFKSSVPFTEIWYSFGRGDYDKALEAYFRISDDFRTAGFENRVRFHVYLGKGEFDAAITLIEEASMDVSREGPMFRTDPSDTDGAELAWLYKTLGRTEDMNEALAWTEGVIEKAKANGLEFDTLVVSAKVSMVRGDHDEAISYLVKASELNLLSWEDRNHALFRELNGRPGFEALFDGIYVHINKERESLGWASLEKSAFLPLPTDG